MNWPLTKTTTADEHDDQTIFMNEEPWLEDGTSQVKPKVAEGSVKKTLSQRQKILLLAGGVFCLLIMLAAISALFVRQQQLVIESSPTPTISTPPVSIDPFAKRFQQVRADLKAADPAKNVLPFPPVDTAIQLNYGSAKSR